MSTTPNETLDIQGTINSYRKAAFGKLAVAGLLGSLAMIFWPAGGIFDLDAKDFEESSLGVSVTCLVLSLVSAASLAFAKETHVYLDFTGRQIVSVDHFAWWETSRRRRPLTDFSHIVVRHLCHPGGEGEDTYTGSVGLKPVQGRAVLWVKSFPATQDEFPRAAHEFARTLQAMMGFPVAATTEFKDETHRI